MSARGRHSRGVSRSPYLASGLPLDALALVPEVHERVINVRIVDDEREVFEHGVIHRRHEGSVHILDADIAGIHECRAPREELLGSDLPVADNVAGQLLRHDDRRRKLVDDGVDLVRRDWINTKRYVRLGTSDVGNAELARV